MFTKHRAGAFLGLALGATVAVAGCSSATEGVLDTFAGEWCTLGGLASSGFPVPGSAYVGMVLLEDGTRVLGTGSTSRPGDETIYPARFAGDIIGGQVTLTVTDLENDTELPGPRFILELRGDGPRDLVGTMSGDPDFTGAIRLVRLGPRCFND